MGKIRVRAGLSTVIVSFIGIGMSANALADSVSIGASHDNTLYQDAAGALSNGAGEFFFSGNTNANVSRRGLIMFDIASAVPAGSTINNVALTLHMSMTSGGASNVELHRVLQAWGEGASDAPGGEGAGTAAMPGDATWLHTFFNTSFWTNPGGDFDPAVSAVQNVDAIGFYTWNSAGMTANVQQWLNNPGTNFGWLLRGDESILNTSKRYDTRENATPGFRPALLIDYTPVPGPASWCIIGLAALGKSRRRGR